MDNFVKCQDGFYALLKESDFSDLESEMNDILIRIDEKTGQVSVIKKMEEEVAHHSLYKALIYQDWFYYDHYEVDDYYDALDHGVVGINLNETEGKKHFLLSSRMKYGNKDLTFLDGKIYYGQQQGKRVTLYSYDLESDEEKELFCYDRPGYSWKTGFTG